MSSQEELLLKLVQGAEGKEWAASRVGWRISSAEPACYWEGVICDSSDRKTVISIHLAETDFFGTLPKELGQMKSLNSIDMRNNLIVGSIPSEIFALPNLETIDLGENQITGTLPVISSHSLHSVKLDHNDLTGTLPDNHEHYYYESMHVFEVKGNHFTGTIPPSFFLQMPKISEISLSENQFSGTIPNELGDLQFLQYLYLDKNNLVGYIPPSIAKPHAKNHKVLKLLEEIWLQDNMLSGTVPPAFAVLELKDFFIDGNKLTGTIPPDLCSVDLNEDFFLGVPFNITYPNRCDAISCPSGTSSAEGVYPCTPCNSKEYNPYLGRIGQCTVLNQRVILDKLYKSTTIGGSWNGENNWGNDDIFLCNFSGVTCDGNNRVIAIELSDRGLKGTIPGELGFLEHLQVLDLSNNELSGFLPSDLRWPPLEKLDISGNHIRGIVPPTLCLKAGINDNGINGDYNCKNIACPKGMYSSSGRETSSEKCIPCTSTNNMFIASTSCAFVQNIPQNEIKPGEVILLILVMLIIGIFVCLLLSYNKKINETYSNFELTKQENEKNAMMDEYVATAGFRRNNRAVSSLPHPEERKGMRGKSHIYSKIRPSSLVTGKMPPPDDPLFIGTFPSSEDNRTQTGTNQIPPQNKKKYEMKGNNVISDTRKNRRNSKRAKNQNASEVMWLDVPSIE